MSLRVTYALWRDIGIIGSILLGVLFLGRP
ncbi:hypothetical protein [Entomobacter blattae]